MQTIVLDTTTIDHTVIHNPIIRLLLRISWFLGVGGYVLIAALGMPRLYEIYRITDAKTIAAYTELNISLNVLPAYLVLTIAVTLVCAVILAAIIFFRAANSWITWFVSITLPLTVVTSNFLLFYVAIAYPPIKWVVFYWQYYALVNYSVFGWIFPDGRFVPRWGRWVCLVAVIWWLQLIPVWTTITPSTTFNELTAPASSIGTLVFGLGTIGAQVYRFLRAAPIVRQQVKWGIFGTVVWFILFVIAYSTLFLVLPLIADAGTYVLVQIVALSLSNYASIIGFAAITFAITRYRLWDIDVVINRSLVGAGVTVVLAIVFTASVFAIQWLTGADNTLIAFAISAIAPALLFTYTHKRVRHFIDRQIYGFRFDMQELQAAQKMPQVLRPGSLSGKKVDGYEVQEVIGQGGMGEVYKGYGNGRSVAIKTVLPTIAQDTVARKRFEREAQAGIQLDHPYIARVYSYGEVDGTPYLVMDFIEGQDLSHRLKNDGKLDEETITRILQDVCAALDVAHNKGFIHRDLKPSNIMIKPNGQAILMDFGITKMTHASTSLTDTGAIGTIDYMAPEQIMSAREVDKRADIYALGVMLYEMLTGEKPFKGIPAQILFSHLQQPVPNAKDINPHIPEAMVAAIKRAMSKNPEDRFQSAGEFAGTLKL